MSVQNCLLKTIRKEFSEALISFKLAILSEEQKQWGERVFEVQQKNLHVTFFGRSSKLEKRQKRTLLVTKKNHWQRYVGPMKPQCLCSRELCHGSSPLTRGSRAALSSKFRIPDQERRIRGALQFNLQSSLKKTRREILFPIKGHVFSHVLRIPSTAAGYRCFGRY